MLNLLLGTVPTWMYNIYPVLKTIFIILMTLSAGAIIAIILIMQSTGQGETTNSITGIKESYFSSNQGSNKENRLKKLIGVSAIGIATFSILYFVLELIYNSF